MNLFRYKQFLIGILLSISSLYCVAQNQVIDRYALCLATLTSLNASENSQKNDIGSDIKAVRTKAFEYIRRLSNNNIKNFDSYADYFSSRLDYYMDYYGQSVQIGGATLFYQTIRSNLKSCD